MIRRHNPSAIFMHWFNALFWIFLLLSGFALLANQSMQPIGQWWVDAWQNFVSPHSLLIAHIAAGSLWIVVYILYVIFFWHSAVTPFLDQITKFSPGKDALWCFRKGMWLVCGPKFMQKYGIETELPAQGFYNAGQRLVAVIAIICSTGLAITGIMMAYFSDGYLTNYIIQWSIVLHFVFAAIMSILLPIHIYMAAFAPGEKPAFRSMFTGYVPKEYARHHNPLWKIDMDNE